MVAEHYLCRFIVYKIIYNITKAVFLDVVDVLHRLKHRCCQKYGVLAEDVP